MDVGLHYEIRALQKGDLAAVKTFADAEIGTNYYTAAELEELYTKSIRDGVMCSFVLIQNSPSTASRVVGIRLSYPHGNWSKGKGSRLRSDLWDVPLDQAAYFQSLFLAAHLQGQGWGQKLSLAAIEQLKKLGAKAVVTHSWRESPHNSSVRYLQKMGFKTIAVHPQYWKDVDYVCTLDGKPCLCTAEEMILYLDGRSA